MLKQLTKEELKSLFSTLDKKAYQKRGLFIYREACNSIANSVFESIQESVLTIVAGKLETIKQANRGDIILRNIIIGSSAETYIVAPDVFEKRYEKTNTDEIFMDGFIWSKAIAKGKINAAQYIGETIEFDAPWGEKMLCETGDWIANPIGGNEDDIYRSEKDTFIQTYDLITQ